MFKTVVACIYSGYRFAKIYSGTRSLGNIEFSTNINYYEDQAWTWMFFLIVGAVVLLIGKRHAFKRYEQFTLNTSCQYTGQILPPLHNFTEFLLKKFHQIANSAVIFFVFNKNSVKFESKTALVRVLHRVLPPIYIFYFFPYSFNLGVLA